MIKFKVIVIIFLIGILSYAKENNITQLLGFKLSQPITTQELKKITIPSPRIIYKNEYQIKPNEIKIPFRKFQTCYIQINSQRRITRIEAIYQAKTTERAKEEYKIVKELLLKKYFTKLQCPFIVITNKEKTRFLTLNSTNQEVKLTCFITDEDPAIKNQERIKKEIEQTDTSGI